MHYTLLGLPSWGDGEHANNKDGDNDISLVYVQQTQDGHYFYLHFGKKETEAETDKESDPKLGNELGKEATITTQPRCSGIRAYSLTNMDGCLHISLSKAKFFMIG